MSHLVTAKADFIAIQGKLEFFDILKQCSQELQNKKKEIQIADKRYCFCHITEKLSNGMPRLCPTQKFTTN